MQIRYEDMLDGTFHASVETEMGPVFIGYCGKHEIFDSAEVEAHVAKVVEARKAAQGVEIEAAPVNAEALWNALLAG